MADQNHIKEKIENGNYVIGSKIQTHSPMMIDISGELGLDYVWIDFEHKGPSATDSTHIQNLVRAAENAGVSILARVPTADPAVIRKVLDSGIRTILISRIETADQLRRAIKASQFVFDREPGNRGASYSYSTDWGLNSNDYMDKEDSSVLIGALIESKKAYENIDEILSVSGIGFIWLGSADMTISLGHSLSEQENNPEVQQIMTRIRDSCHKFEVPMGESAYTPKKAKESIDEGVQIINIGGEIESYSQTLISRIESMKYE